MTSDQRNLEILSRRQREYQERNFMVEESKILKNALLVQYRWPDLLQLAPAAINSMGACFVASSSAKAQVDLRTPDKGFQYLRYRSFNAELVETANRGRYAFKEAEMSMGQVSQALDGVGAKTLWECVDPEASQVLLRPQMLATKKAVDTSTEATKRACTKFDDWLFQACELHAACVEKERTDQDVQISTYLCMTAQSCKLDTQQDNSKIAQAATDVFKKQVEVSNEAFKKASDDFPTGWQITGQQIAIDTSKTADAAVKALIPALVMSINPAPSGSQTLGGFLNGAPQGATQTNKVDFDDAKLKSPVDQSAVALKKDIVFLEMLNVIVNGPNGKIDSNIAKSSSSNGKSSIEFLANMLEAANNSSRQFATNSDTGETVSRIYANTAKFSREIAQAIKNNANVDSNQWQGPFTELYNQAQSISAGVTVSQGSPGIEALLSNHELVTGDDLDTKSLPGQTHLRMSQNRLFSTQAALITSRENYLKACSNTSEQQKKLVEIQSNLARFATSNASLTEIKKILVESIKLILVIKGQYNNLMRALAALSVTIGSVIQIQVEPYVQFVKRLVSGQNDPNSDRTLAGCTLADKNVTDLGCALNDIRTYSNVVGDIAKFWNRLSMENMMPGLKMCDELSMISSGDGREASRSFNTMTSWARQATENMNRIAEETQSNNTQSMDDSITNVSDTIKQLSPAPAQRSIEIARTDAVQAVAAALTAKRDNSPLFKAFLQQGS